MFLLLLMAPAPYDLPLPECVVVADEGPQVANAPAPIGATPLLQVQDL